MNSILQLNALDNVAIATNSIDKGTDIECNGLTIQSKSSVHKMHKIAVKGIQQGEEVIKFGQVIGTATNNITAGEHVHTHNCDANITSQPELFCQNRHPTQFVEQNKKRYFQGFDRGNGRYGTRNYIGILTSVNCSATVAKQTAAHFSYPNALEQYPNVDGVVALTYTGGCGMSASGEAYELLERTLLGYLKHPNFAGVLFIGLGCEAMQISRLIKEHEIEENKSLSVFNIQESGGTKSSIEKGIANVTAMMPLAAAASRTPIPVSELKLAVQCGGSDAFSGVTANPALGTACDLLVQQGGTVIYSETPEIYGAEHLLAQRAETPEVAQQLMDRIHWWEEYTKKNHVTLNNNPSPGNKAGGLTTILEKSLGAQAKAGSTDLRAVYLYSQEITERGLVFMDSPGFDPVSVTGQVASGANVIAFTTGRGSAFGFKPVPSLKLATNSQLFENMRDDMDINCGEVINGKLSVEECGNDIFEEIIAVASGKKTTSEELDYGNNEFNPWVLGATV